nr:sodefrin precursor-like factor alpha 2 [Eurycea tynerensis]
MMALLFGIILLSAFMATGHSLECVQCFSFTETDCTGEQAPCPDDITTCQTIVSQSVDGDTTSFQVFKDCGAKEQRNPIFREESPTSYYQQDIKTCDTDGCNQGPVSLTPRDNTPNGVKCKTCSKTNDLDCESDEVMECSGALDKCLFVAGEMCDEGDGQIDCAFRLCSDLHIAELHPFHSGQLDNILKKIEITDSV